jgi:hypothetical protein
LQIARHRPGAALVIPNTKRVATNRDLTTIIRSQHELNRLMHRDRDEASQMHHEQIIRATLNRLTVVAAIDIVLNLTGTQRVQTR